MMLWMLRSIESLQNAVAEPISESLGPKAKVLTVESHGDEIHGLALCPGRVVSFVLSAQRDHISTKDLLTLKINKISN